MDQLQTDKYQFEPQEPPRFLTPEEQVVRNVIGSDFDNREARQSVASLIYEEYSTALGGLRKRLHNFVGVPSMAEAITYARTGSYSDEYPNPSPKLKTETYKPAEKQPPTEEFIFPEDDDVDTTLYEIYMDEAQDAADEKKKKEKEKYKKKEVKKNDSDSTNSGFFARLVHDWVKHILMGLRGRDNSGGNRTKHIHKK